MDLLLDALRQAGAVIKARNAIHCPFHDDRVPSAGVYTGKDGVVRFKCHGGTCGFHGDLYDVRAKASGRPLEEVLKAARPADGPIRQPRSPAPDPKRFSSVEAAKLDFGLILEAVYTYANPVTGKPELHVFRLKTPDGKRFIQATPNHDGIILKAPPDPKPLYNRSRVAQAEEVVVVEGEKCVHELHKHNIVATTWPGGCKAVGKADWTPLAGKWVVLWPDNDAGGIAAMREVAAILETLDPPAKVRLVDIGALELPEKGDVVDFAAALPEQGGVKQAIHCVLLDARLIGPSSELADMIEDTIAGRRRALQWPWPMIGNMTQALAPGMSTILCGDPGASKSFMLLESFFHWHSQGYKVALYELEDDRAYHLNRLLAQVQGDSRLFSADWIEKNPDEARAAYKAHADAIDGFGRRLYVAPDRQLTLPDLAVWVEERCAEGLQIIGIDPITIAEPTEKPWVSDLAFLVRVKTAIRKTGARLILVTHPKKGRKTAVGLDELAGGAAWPRFNHTVLWLQAFVPPKRFIVNCGPGKHEMSVNRVVRVCKARNGRGHGLEIAYDFRGDTLTFAEMGLIVEAAKKPMAGETDGTSL